MKITSDPWKQGLVFTCFVYSSLLIFASVFYFERLNSDAGYYFFHSVNLQWFHVEHQRFVLIMAEIFPVAGSNLHLPLKLLAILYSVSHVLFPAVLTYVILVRFKNNNAAILMTVMQFAGLRFAVVTPQFELFYGLNLLVFAMAYLEYKDPDKVLWNILHYSFFGLLLVLIFTSHPMAVYCYIACIAVYFFKAKYKPLLVQSAIFILIYFVWKKLTASEYEQSKLMNFSNAFNQNSIGHYLSFDFIKKGWVFLLWHYPDVLILFFIGMVYMIREKQYRKLIANIIFLKFSIILIWLMFEPDTLNRYIEQVYFPFVFIACLWLLKCTINIRLYTFLLIFFIFRVVLILDSISGYRNRTLQMAEFTKTAQQQAGTKFYVTQNEMGEKLYAQGNWSFGFETMFYSAIHYKKTVTITKLEDLEYNDNLHQLKPDDFLFRPFDIIPFNDLNRRYFRLENGGYILLKYPKTD